MCVYMCIYVCVYIYICIHAFIENFIDSDIDIEIRSVYIPQNERLQKPRRFSARNLSGQRPTFGDGHYWKRTRRRCMREEWRFNNQRCHFKHHKFRSVIFKYQTCGLTMKKTGFKCRFTFINSSFEHGRCFSDLPLAQATGGSSAEMEVGAIFVLVGGNISNQNMLQLHDVYIYTYIYLHTILIYIYISIHVYYIYIYIFYLHIRIIQSYNHTIIQSCIHTCMHACMHTYIHT